MKQNKATVAIIGLGKIACGYDEGGRHQTPRTHLGAILQDSNLRLLAVCDRSIEARKRFEKNWHINIPVFNDVAELLNNVKPDILVVAVNSQYQHEVMRQCSYSKGLRLLFCEKPFCENSKEAKDICDLYGDKKIPIVVNYHRRWDVRIQEFKKILREQNEIKVGYFKFTKGWRNYGTHAIDFLQYLFGRVTAVQSTIINNDSDKKLLNAALYFENNICIQLLEVNFVNYELFDLEVLTTTGAYIFEFGGEKILKREVVSHPMHQGYSVMSDSIRILEDAQIAGLSNAYEEIGKWVLDGIEMDTNLADSFLSVHAVLDAIEASTHSNQKVLL